MTAIADWLPSRSWLPSRRVLVQAAVFVAAVVAAKLVAAELDAQGVIHASTPLTVIVKGTIVGMTYGLLAVGLVLIYRTNRIINFAHGQIGAFAAAFFSLVAVKGHVPYWIAFVLALFAAGAVGAGAETAVVRRLRNAPRLMSVVATLGVGQVLIVFAILINPQSTASSTYPLPAGLPVFTIGALRITPAYSAMLFLSPVVVLAIAVFFKRSRFGLGIRAAAANPEAARMSGIFASRMSSLAWAIAGALSAFTAILTAPTQGFVGGDSFGPDLLLRAMTAAVVGRMQSLPLALAGGVGLGIVEEVLIWNYQRSPGLVDVALFVLILAVLLLQRQRAGRDEEKGSWAAVQALRPLPRELQQVRAVRLLGPVLGVAMLAFLALMPLFITNSLSDVFTAMIAFAIVGLSIGVLTGLGGQLTLGQFGIAAVGAVVSYKVSSRIGEFPLALLYAGLGAGVVSVAVGLPALRIRGLMLTVTTLGFALASPWLLGQPWMLGDGRDPGRPTGWPLGRPLDTGRSYYYFALTLFVLSLLLARNVRRGGFGRLLVAIRDNEDNARAFTVRASVVKMQGYLLAGFIAGLGGATLGHSHAIINDATFPVIANIQVVVMTVLGGVSVLIGAVIGAVWVIGLPHLDIGNIGLFASNVGILIVILTWPGGLVQAVDPVRMRVVRTIARWRGVDVDRIGTTDAAAAAATPMSLATLRARDRSAVPAQRRPATGTTLLEARHLSKRFGGVTAVHDVSLRVRAGETVGLIGPNGAGKTTTFELLGGFTRPDTGRVFFDRRDVSPLGPEDRARLGLIRSFQDAALFPTMTVRETVMLALERVQPTGFLGSALGFTVGERAKAKRADELVSALGLDAYRDKQIQELSTGTRRIAEIACLVALEPVCLLLDEPSSGIAQRETEALGQLLVDLKNQLDLTLVVIEHDIPLVMGISDRIVAMADGVVIADGTPDVVQRDPVVIDAYLGGSVDAISRSGTRPTTTPSRTPVGEVLRGVRGLGDAKTRTLLATLGGNGAVHGATVEELQQVPGVGPELARRIRAALDS